MKAIDILKVILTCTLSLVAISCEDVIETTEQTLQEDLTFQLKEDAVYLNTASIRIKHNGTEATQWVYLQTSDLTTDADQLINERVNTESELTDQVVSYKGTNKSLTLSNLEAKQTYRLIVKAIDPETGVLYGKTAELIFKTRRDPDVWEDNSNWSMSRQKERSQGVMEGSTEVIEFENFECKSTDEESYIILTLSKSDFDNYKKGEGHKDKIRTIFEDYHSDISALEEYKDYILKGSGIWKEQRLRSGDYVTFMIGVDEDGELSGLYKRTDVTIEEEEPIESYNRWLGWWEISFNDDSDPWMVYIEDLDANMWLLSIGWEPEAIGEAVYNMGLKIYFDKSSGKLYFTSQEVASSEDGSKVYYYGVFQWGTYQTVLDIENIRIAEANITDIHGTQAKITGLNTFLPNAGDIQFNYSVFYLSYPGASVAASGEVPRYPWTMKKIDAPM